MSERRVQLAESRAEIDRLAAQPLSEVTPSRRDFAQYIATQKQGLAVVARLGRNAAAKAEGLVAYAQACDDAEVAALMVAAGPSDLRLQDMATVAAGTTAPILRQSLVLDRSQIFAARLHGADAVILATREIDRADLDDLVAVTRSLHMAPVLEVVDSADLAIALTIPHLVLGLNCVDGSQKLDIAQTLEVAAQIPKQRSVLALPEIERLDDAARLVGHCDAIVLGEVLVAAADIAAELAHFLQL